MMDKRPDDISDEMWKAINDPKLKRVTDAIAAWDKGEISAYEFKVIVEENTGSAPVSYTHLTLPTILLV